MKREFNNTLCIMGLFIQIVAIEKKGDHFSKNISQFRLHVDK